MNKKSVRVSNNYIEYSIQCEITSKKSGSNVNNISAIKVPPMFTIIKYILKSFNCTIPVIRSTNPSHNAKTNAPQKSSIWKGR